METLALILMIGIVRGTLVAIERFANRPTAGEPLCDRCAFAHIEFRVNGRRDLFCGVGGSLRKVRGVVGFCTSFMVRVPPHIRGPVGFVQLAERAPQSPALTGD